MNSRHSGTAVVIERKIYFLAYDESVHVYDVDQGIYIVPIMEYLQIVIFDIYRSVEHCQHVEHGIPWEILAIDIEFY